MIMEDNRKYKQFEVIVNIWFTNASKIYMSVTS